MPGGLTGWGNRWMRVDFDACTAIATGWKAFQKMPHQGLIVTFFEDVEDEAIAPEATNQPIPVPYLLCDRLASLFQDNEPANSITGWFADNSFESVSEPTFGSMKTPCSN